MFVGKARAEYRGAMIRFIFSLAVLAVLAPLPAQAAKPKHCITDPELRAEQAVRHGIFLREAGQRCNDYNPGTAKQWKDFDGRFASQLSGQTAKRAKFFQREFPDSWKNMMTYYDGRLVTYNRNFPLTRAYCGMIEELLQENLTGGWGAFTTQAKLTQDESRLEYKLCSPPR
jgi:hypothetical protein